MAEDLKNAAGPDALAERRLLRYLNARDIDADVAVFRDQSGRLRAVIESARLSRYSGRRSTWTRYPLSWAPGCAARPAPTGRKAGWYCWRRSPWPYPWGWRP